jgi:hypothetical protein
VTEVLTNNLGKLGPEGAMALLQDVAQDNTQWSVVYAISSGRVRVVLGQDYENVHAFGLGRTTE